LVEGFVKDRISIVMPAYNEAHCIGRSVADVNEQFEAMSEDYEIIVVDDGSNDDTRKIIEELTDKKLKIVGYDRNQGKGHALKVGLFNFRIKELPVNIDLRATFSARQVFRMLIDLLGIAYRLRIKRWYQTNKASMSDTYTPIIQW